MTDSFTPEEIERCKEAMSKPAPMGALRLIASGRAVIELASNRRDVLVSTIDGKPVRDPDYPDDPSRRMGLAGAWPLYRAGMIDQFGCVTEAGRELLARTPA